MLLGFKAQFAPFVEDGSKTHTIRAPRKDRPIRVGDRLDCYTNVRQQNMRLLGRWLCTKVETIEIRLDPKLYIKSALTGRTEHFKIAIDGQPLDYDEAVAFAFRDGFRGRDSVCQMAAFWMREHALSADNPFHGHLIHWDFQRRLVEDPR